MIAPTFGPLWPLLRHLHLALPQNPPGIPSALQREAPPRIVKRGYMAVFRSGSIPG